MKDLSLFYSISASICSTVFIAGGFYQLVKWRLKKLEEKDILNDETRNSVIRIETKIDLLLKNNS